MANQKDNKSAKYNWQDYSSYSSFEFLWGEIILCQGILKKEHLLSLLDKFEITFFKKNWRKKLPKNELGNTILADTPKEKLFSLIKKILKKYYPQLLTFDEAQKIYKELHKLAPKELEKIYFNISSNDKLKKFIKQESKEGAIREAKSIPIKQLNKSIREFLQNPSKKLSQKQIWSELKTRKAKTYIESLLNFILVELYKMPKKVAIKKLNSSANFTNVNF